MSDIDVPRQCGSFSEFPGLVRACAAALTKGTRIMHSPRLFLLALPLWPALAGCAVDSTERNDDVVEATGTSAQKLTLAGFPSALLTEHTNWHMNTPGTPGARRVPMGSAGSGLEFLQFHRDFVPRALAWYYAQPNPNYDAVAPWYSIPSELKTAANRWNSAFAALETRIMNNDFASDDAFGIALEPSIHAFLHNASASQYGDPNIGSIMTSPLSSYFYKIHGLIDYWWARYQFAKGNSGHKTNGFRPIAAGGCVMDLATGGGVTWALGCQADARGDYQLFRTTGSSWQFMGNGAGKQIAVSPEGTPWVIDHAGTVKKWNGASFVAVSIGGCATSIGVGAKDNVWITGCSASADHSIYHLAGNPWGRASWRLMPGAAIIAKVSENGVPWVVNSHGGIFRWEPSGWQQTPGCGTALAVGQNGTFILGCDHDDWANASIWQWSETARNFVSSNGRAAEVAVAGNGTPWVANDDGATFIGNP